MDENKNNTNEESLEFIKQQENLAKLMQVLDDCIESMDKFYYFVKTREMLSLSKDN